ncbi:MAG: ATP-binding cassette domain-containing protein [Acidimicrobiales bacterium]
MSKRFGAVVALEDAHITLRSGEVRALVGANGSGKSTLVKILSGFHRPDSGVLKIGDIEADLNEDWRHGEHWQVGTVHQDLGLLTGVSVVENFLLPELAVGHAAGVKLNWRKLRSSVASHLGRFDVDTSLVRRKINECPRVTQAVIALARAVWILEGGFAQGTSEAMVGDAQRPATLILDEITAFLSLSEVAKLREVIRGVAASGHSVLLVSHDLDEVLSFADEVTVFRDGRVVAERRVTDVKKAELFSVISGISLDETQAATATRMSTSRQSLSIEVSDLRAGEGAVGPLSFDISPGEVLGITGLLGSGFENVPYALFGADPSARGTLTINGSTCELAGVSPARSMAQGVALVPGDRGAQGLWGDMTIAENLSASDGSLSLHPWLQARAPMWRRGDAAVREYAIKAPSSRSKIAELSGGNAQRVLMAKWLAVEIDFLLLDEPVRGVDVGARLQIAELILDRASRGLSVLCATSDHEFLSQVAHRVLVFANGELSFELHPKDGASFVAKDDMVWACQAKEDSSNSSNLG